MFFHRKGRLRKEFDQELISLLEQSKQELIRQKRIVEQSLEPSEDVICHMLIAEAKYFYLLRSAKLRQVKMVKL
ncbi:YaaL family protein [Ectobacillus ponti]|uniref:YaaL family protein n=1 Tax=Ectobacillus ponti TaxID=2961894 RepID=A0AA42BSG0_9BACI|nr:YaaL family protein [Ectobacillus ponti]MCP8971351.1 YaaL family protein [Ectobacillus ponti]